MSGKPSGLAPCGKDSMAGDDEGDGIPAQSSSNSLGCGGPAQGISKVGVGDSLPHRDFASGLAHLLHKRTSPVQVHRDVTKVLKFALKVFAHSINDYLDL
jgi:hypothetical protein